ncbi:hypothetical protein ONE63_008850 [Megalurothrips usitatus]|uniref:Uncharacterized protein n=1 Tax=Megalurothrips usitatus TaxID=439358 RepID=A0AAV7XL65_9NEOP|nr:hypothetical protein ONE63_008850 [Megalurothrips usitatus]
MAVSLGQALDTLGEFSWLLLAIVALHAAVQVRKYQDTFPTSGPQHVARGLLATVWFGMGSALAQTVLLAEPAEAVMLPVAVCVAAYLAVSYCPNDVLYKLSQSPAVNAVLIVGLEICRALCVGVGVSGALKVYSGNNAVAAMVGALRGAWGWLLGRPGAKVILGQPVGETSWPAPPVSAPASAVAAVLLVLAGSRSDAEMIIGGLIAVLVAWRSYEILHSAF